MDPDVPAVSQNPEHAKWSRAADALCTFAVNYEEPPDADGRRPAETVIWSKVFTCGTKR